MGGSQRGWRAGPVCGHYVNWSFENHPVLSLHWMGAATYAIPVGSTGSPVRCTSVPGDGRFREASIELGFDRIGKTLGVVIADLNRDGRSDVYVANDTLANHLYLSQPGGAFRESAIEMRCCPLARRGSPTGAWGSTWGTLTVMA